jgi:hypothetical protein
MEEIFDPLSEDDKTAYAEMYIKEMEKRWQEGRPYKSPIDLANSVRQREKCGIGDALRIVTIIKKSHLDKVRAMGYTIEKSSRGISFYLTREQFEEIQRKAGVLKN